MAKKVLVCLDGSVGTARATDYAIGLSRKLGATLAGLAVVADADITAAQASGIGGSSFKQHRDEVLLADAEKAASARLDTFLAQTRAAGVAAQTLQVTGAAAATILEQIKGYDATVFARTTTFIVDSGEGDSKTRDEVLHRAERPVILVPEDARDSGPDIVVAYDGTAAAKRALRALAELGLAKGHSVHVVTVDDEGPTAFETALKGVALLRELGVTSEAHSIVSALPIADAILHYATRRRAGLLVMGAYIRSRVTAFIWGSITHEVIEKTTLPLLLQT